MNIHVKKRQPSTWACIAGFREGLMYAELLLLCREAIFHIQTCDRRVTVEQLTVAPRPPFLFL